MQLIRPAVITYKMISILEQESNVVLTLMHLVVPPSLLHALPDIISYTKIKTGNRLSEKMQITAYIVEKDLNRLREKRI